MSFSDKAEALGVESPGVALVLPPSERKAAERRLVRKLDWILTPLLGVTFGLQYYDKAALGSAAAFGILQDLVRAPACDPPSPLTPEPRRHEEREDVDDKVCDGRRVLLLRLHCRRAAHGDRVCALQPPPVDWYRCHALGCRGHPYSGC